MQAIVFNKEKSKISYLGEALALRACFLICNETCAAGSSYVAINIERNFAFGSIDQKLQAVKHSLSRSENPEKLKTVNEVGEVFRMLKNKKNKLQRDIIMAKQSEKFILEMYEEVKRNVISMMQDAGLEQLSALCVRGSDFFCCPLHPETQENNQSKEKDSAVKLLQHILEGITPEFFCLTHEFLKPDYLQEQQITLAEPASASADDAVYLKQCFTFPNVNLLNAEELKLVRSQLRDARSDWNRKMIAWRALIKNGEKNTGNYFEEIIMPAANLLQEKIDENDILKNIALTQHNAVKMQLWVGEMPLHFIWNFYRNHNALVDTAWNALQEAKEKDILLTKREAVMALYIPENKDAPKPAQAGETVAPSKKSISID